MPFFFTLLFFASRGEMKAHKISLVYVMIQNMKEIPLTTRRETCIYHILVGKSRKEYQ